MTDIPNQDNQTPIVIVWDPALISAEEYADIVTAIGDVVRAEGGVGIERIWSQAFSVPR